MDKLLLDALNNLSLSLENLTVALQQKSETKSDVAGALSSGDISKKLDQILDLLKSGPKSSESVLESSKAGKPMLSADARKPTSEFSPTGSIKPSVPTSIKPTIPTESVLESSKSGKPMLGPDAIKPTVPTSKKPSIISNPYIKDGKWSGPVIPVKIVGDDRKKMDMSRPSVENVSKEGEDNKKKSLFSDDQKKSIGDGVKLLLLMAVGIVAIGLAFKIVGGVNVASVLALAVALPLVAIAFEKISRIKTTPREMMMVSASLVIIAGAIMLTSIILSKVRPIGLAQAFSTIVIAGAFAVISTQIGKLISSLGEISTGTAIVASLLMPIVLVAVSYSIMKSSEFIRNVKPIGIQQMFSTIVIAATFAIISTSLGKLIGAFQGINPLYALVAAAIMPIVLVGVSYAIMKSSEFIKNVKPIGIQQAFSSIVIAGVFTLIGFGIGKMLRAFDDVNPIEAISFSLVAPLILIGISYAIMKSSEFIRNVKPVGLQQFFASAAISLVFVILSFGIKQIVKAIDGLNSMDIVKAAVFAPIIFIALSYAIMESSQFIRMVKPIGIQQFFSSVMISVIFVAISFAIKFIVKNTRGITAKDMVKSGLILVAMTIGILAASQFIGLIPNISNSKMNSFIKLSLVLVSLSGIALAITKITKNISKNDMIKASLVIVTLALTIALTSLMLSMGDYDKYPSIEWTLTNLFTLSSFGLLASGLGLLINKVGKKEFFVGSVAIVILSAAIAVSSQILSMGDYSKYPGLSWSLGVGLSLLVFGMATLALGSLITLSVGLGAGAMALGAAAVLGLAATIVATDQILSSGSYTNFPGNDWIGSVAKSLLLFGTAVVTLGALSSGGGLIEGITFGLVENPIDAGIETVRKLSEIIVETSSILAGGDYGSFPTDKWISGVSKTLLLFGTAVVSLGALSSGGGALEGISFGLVKNPITAGIDAIKAISQSIVDADEILSTGSYTGGPKVEWSKGIGLALGSFSSVYKMMMNSQILSLFTGGRVGSETFTGSIKSISEAIKVAGDTLSDGNFTGGPNVEWAKGVGIAIGAFSQVYEMMEKSQIMKFFSRGNLGVSVESFSSSIRTISRGIKDASVLLGTSTFTGGPDEAWAKGVGLSIGAFSEVYSMLQKQKIFDLFGAGVDIESFKAAIVTISEGLKEARDQLTKEDGWTGGPSETWAAGVGQSIAAFAPVFTAVSETVGFFPGPKIEDFKSAIITISKGIIEAAGVFSFSNAVFDLSKAPKAEWGQNVGAAINAFAPVFQYLSDNSGWFGDEDAALKLQNAILVIASAIKSSSITLSLGNYSTVIDSNWSRSINRIFKDYIDLFSNSDIDTDFDTMSEKSISLGTIASAIKNTSVTLSLGKYGTNFGKYDKAVKGLFNSFLDTYVKIEKVEVTDKLLSNTFKVARNIKDVSNVLFVSKLKLNANDSYSKIVKGLFDSYISIYRNIRSYKIDNEIIRRTQLVARGISNISIELSRGKFVNFPKPSWSDGAITALSKFSTIMSLVDFSKFEKKFGKNIGLSMMISDIGMLARVFDRLAESLQKVSSSIGTLDSAKIESIRTLTSNVVLLSLMDAAQFDRMMAKLEENSILFNHLIGDSRPGMGSPVGSISGKNKEMKTVKTPSSSPTRGSSSESIDQQNLMKKLVDLMADISVVVGSKGSLSEYLQNKDSKKVGSLSWFSGFGG